MHSTSASPPSANQARYNDGRTATSRLVELRFDETALIVQDEDGAVVATWPYAAIHRLPQDSRHDPVRVRIDGSDERLTIAVPFTAQILAERCPDWTGRKVGGRSTRALVMWGVAAVASVVALFWFLLPLVAEQTAALVPVSMERRSGEWIATEIDKALRQNRPVCGNAPGREALDKVVASLTAVDNPRLPVVIHVVNSSIVNAVALPGGHIIVFSGLLKFTNHPNELAGILAHEIGHSDLRHPSVMAIKSGATGFLIGLLLGDITGASTAIIVGQTLLNASYGRELEKAADFHAFQVMKAANFDTRPFGAFFDRIAKMSGSSSGLSLIDSHPPSEIRAELARTANPSGGDALDFGEWRALKAICD